MPESIQQFDFNSLYVCLALLAYNVCKSNCEYINIIYEKLYSYHYCTLIIIFINVVGLTILLKNVTFQISIKYSIYYNK